MSLNPNSAPIYPSGVTISTGLSDSANLARLDAANVFSAAQQISQGTLKLGTAGGTAGLLQIYGTSGQVVAGGDYYQKVKSNGMFGFSNSSSNNSTADTSIGRVSAGVMGVAASATSIGDGGTIGTMQAHFKSSDGSSGIDTTITTASLVGKTITIKDGLITGFA